MKIAKLDQRIDILEPRLTRDGYGGYTTEYLKAKGVWAEIKSSSYTGRQAFNTPAEKNTVTMRIRPYAAIKKGWHVLWQEREYEAVSVQREYKDSVYIELTEYEAGV